MMKHISFIVSILITILALFGIFYVYLKQGSILSCYLVLPINLMIILAIWYFRVKNYFLGGCK